MYDKKQEIDIIFINFNTKINCEKYNWDNIKKLVDGINGVRLFILFDDKFINIETYNKILEKLTSISINCYFNSIFKDYKSITEHSCNIYLCDGKNCHSNKSRIPRYLYVSNKGIYPYKVNDTKLNIIDNISTKKN